MDRFAIFSGAMDEASDGGVDWRTRITPKLFKMGIGVFNPCDKPVTGHIEDDKFRAELREHRTQGNHEKAKMMVRPIVGVDLRMVHLSSFIILYIDKNIFMCGSTVEATWALQQRKPLLIVCKQGINEIPLFLFGMNPYQLMFNNFDEMMIYLNHIDSDPVVDDLRRWQFFDYNKVFGRKVCSPTV